MLARDNDRWVTVNADLTASIVAQGIPCSVETYDGFQVEFVFGGEYAIRARKLAEQWISEDDLPAPSRTLTVVSRRLRIEMRKVREAYSKQRVPIKKEFSR